MQVFYSPNKGRYQENDIFIQFFKGVFLISYPCDKMTSHEKENPSNTHFSLLFKKCVQPHTITP